MIRKVVSSGRVTHTLNRGDSECQREPKGRHETNLLAPVPESLRHHRAAPLPPAVPNASSTSSLATALIRTPEPKAMTSPSVRKPIERRRASNPPSNSEEEITPHQKASPIGNPYLRHGSANGSREVLVKERTNHGSSFPQSSCWPRRGWTLSYSPHRCFWQGTHARVTHVQGARPLECRHRRLSLMVRGELAQLLLLILGCNLLGTTLSRLPSRSPWRPP